MKAPGVLLIRRSEADGGGGIMYMMELQEDNDCVIMVDVVDAESPNDSVPFAWLGMIVAPACDLLGCFVIGSTFRFLPLARLWQGPIRG